MLLSLRDVLVSVALSIESTRKVELSGKTNYVIALCVLYPFLYLGSPLSTSSDDRERWFFVYLSSTTLPFVAIYGTVVPRFYQKLGGAIANSVAVSQCGAIISDKSRADQHALQVKADYYLRIARGAPIGVFLFILPPTVMNYGWPWFVRKSACEYSQCVLERKILMYCGIYADASPIMFLLWVLTINVHHARALWSTPSHRLAW